MMRFDRSAHRAQLIMWLEKNASPKALNLAAVLETCTKQRPCRSRACPVCGEAFQQAMVAVTRKMICEPATATIRGRKSALTLIPAVGILDPEDLDTSLVSSVVEIFELSMIAAKLPICVGSLDFSFNEDQTGEHDPHWSVHGSLVCFDWLSKEQKDALRLCQGKSPNVSRPVVSVELDENEEGLQYQFKPERTRRVSYLQESDRRNDFRDTRSRPLRTRQAVQLALVEHEVGFAGSLLSHGIDRAEVWRCLEAEGWPQGDG